MSQFVADKMDCGIGLQCNILNFKRNPLTSKIPGSQYSKSHQWLATVQGGGSIFLLVWGCIIH